MHWHPTDDDLTLHHYGEVPPGVAARIDAHLRVCGTCRETWDELGETLTLVSRVEVPEPDGGFERVMWARIRPELPAPAAARGAWLRFWVPAAGLAAAVIAGVSASLMRSPAGPVTPAVAAPAAAADAGPNGARERVLLTALDGHFEQTEMLLVELMNAPADDAEELEFQRATAEDLVADGRLYRATAEETGDTQLVRMLEDLEPVLVDLARGPRKLDRTELDSLRARIGDEDLLFKVRAVTGEIRGRQQNLFAVSEGPL